MIGEIEGILDALKGGSAKGEEGEGYSDE